MLIFTLSIITQATQKPEKILDDFVNKDIKIFNSAYSFKYLAEAKDSDEPLMVIESRFYNHEKLHINDIAKIIRNRHGYYLKIGESFFCVGGGRRLTKCKDEKNDLFKIIPTTFGWVIRKEDECLTQVGFDEVKMEPCVDGNGQVFDFKLHSTMNKCEQMAKMLDNEEKKEKEKEKEEKERLAKQKAIDDLAKEKAKADVEKGEKAKEKEASQSNNSDMGSNGKQTSGQNEAQFAGAESKQPMPVIPFNPYMYPLYMPGMNRVNIDRMPPLPYYYGLQMPIQAPISNAAYPVALRESHLPHDKAHCPLPPHEIHPKIVTIPGREEFFATQQQQPSALPVVPVQVGQGTSAQLRPIDKIPGVTANIISPNRQTEKKRINLNAAAGNVDTNSNGVKSEFSLAQEEQKQKQQSFNIPSYEHKSEDLNENQSVTKPLSSKTINEKPASEDHPTGTFKKEETQHETDKSRFRKSEDSNDTAVKETSPEQNTETQKTSESGKPADETPQGELEAKEGTKESETTPSSVGSAEQEAKEKLESRVSEGVAGNAEVNDIKRQVNERAEEIKGNIGSKISSLWKSGLPFMGSD